LAVAGRFLARGGWAIEAISLNGRDCFRVSRLDVYVGRGYCYSVEELVRILEAHGIGLSDLIEDEPECE
jgi:hypothetical protein